MKANALSLFFFVGLVSVGSGSLAKEPLTLNNHADGISSLAFSPDSKMLVSSSYDGTVRFSDAGSGKEIAAIKMGVLVHDVAFSPDGKLLALALVGSDVAIFDVATRNRIRRLAGHKKYVLHVVFSRDGKTLASADGAGAIRLWNTDQWTVDKTLVMPSRARILAIDLSADGKWLAAGAGNAMAHVWDRRTGALQFSIGKAGAKHKSYLGDVAFSPDSKQLAITSGFIGGGVHIYDVSKPETPRARYSIPWYAAGWRGLAFTPDGKELACASGYWYVSLVKFEQKKRKEGEPALDTIPYPIILWARDKRGEPFVEHIAVSPDGKKLAYSAHTRYTKGQKTYYFIQLWDVSEFRQAARKRKP